MSAVARDEDSAINGSSRILIVMIVVVTSDSLFQRAQGVASGSLSFSGN